MQVKPSKKSQVLYVDSAYHFQYNKEGYRMTLREFGATGCNSFRMMEKAMEEVRSKYPSELKVQFLNVLLPVNQDMMKYFGVAAIPTRVKQNISGLEVFMHTDYLAFEDIDDEFQKINP